MNVASAAAVVAVAVGLLLVNSQCEYLYRRGGHCC